MSTTRIIPVIDGVPHPLGRHVEHDEASRAFAFPASAAPSKPVLWPHHGPVLDQGSLGSCCGNAMEQCLATGPLFRVGFTPTEKQALSIYELATRLDGVPGQYPPTDTGSSGLGVAKAAKSLGLIRSYQHVFGITHAMQTIASTPFIVGTEWYEGMFNPDFNGFLNLTGQVAGGHEYLCLGFDGVATWTFLNSWGPTWGRADKAVALGGLFHLRHSDFATLLSNQGDITVPVR